MNTEREALKRLAAAVAPYVTEATEESVSAIMTLSYSELNKTAKMLKGALRAALEDAEAALAASPSGGRPCRAYRRLFTEDDLELLLGVARSMEAVGTPALMAAVLDAIKPGALTFPEDEWQFVMPMDAASSTPGEAQERIVLWTCSRCERVARMKDGDTPPICVGPVETDPSEAEHELTLMLGVPFVRESTLPTVTDDQESKEHTNLIERFARVLATPDCNNCDEGIDWEGSEYTLCECVLKRLVASEERR